MAHISRTDLRKGTLKKEDVEKALQAEQEKPAQMGLFTKQNETAGKKTS